MSILKLKDSQGNWISVPTVKGDTGNGISSAILNDDYTLTLTFTDGTTYKTPSIRGNKGDKGDKGDTGEVAQAEFDELSGKVSDLKSDLTHKANTDGSYDTLTAGNAKQLLSNIEQTDTVPYNYRTAGGSLEIGDREKLKKIVGGSLAVNQLVKNGNFADGSGWTTNNGNVSVASNKLTFTLTGKNNFAYVGRTDLENSIVGHKYFVGAYITVSEASSYLAISRGGVYSDRFFTLAVDARTYCAKVFNATASNGNFYIYPRREGTGFEVGSTMIVEDAICHDLTAMFGSTIADYVYSLETATAGAGVAWLKAHFPRIFDAGYISYNTGELKSVEGVSAHVMRDADSNIIGNYPLDNSLTLRGIPKMSDGKMYFDGDRYLPDGTVERRYGIRAYQSGDESLADAITDGTNTVYKLTATNTEEATPYRQLQICDPYGTEEFVSTGIIPVGHDTRYPENLRAKIDGLPWDFSSLIAPTEKTTTASRNYTTGSLLIMGNTLYKVTANIANGGTITPNTNVTATTLSEILSALAQ